jgi:demethylmenaquinone methyltransferase/2-methoxy-6-polyprenyl-1,4-benzoquinol methylase
MAQEPAGVPVLEGSGQMFDGIAHRYDLLNRLLSLGLDRRWRRRTVRELALGPDARVLDVATGTGDLALDLAESGSGVAVVGLDPAPRMLELARHKAEAEGLALRVRFVVGSAESLPFADGEFDAATIAFGIRNVPDRLLALREMRRVTRASGRVAVLELSEPVRGLLAPCARLYLHRVVPWLGALLSGRREYRYLQRSIAAFPPPSEFSGLMEKAGLRVKSVIPLSFGACHLYVATVEGRG